MRKENNLRTLTEVISRSKKVWVSSAELANILGVSTRTVRNYVNEINKSEKVILSSGIGYAWNNANKDAVRADIYDNKALRQHNLVCKIVVSRVTLDVFDVADELGVSESTILNDLKRLTPFFQENNLSLNIENWDIHLSGTEVAKRKFLKTLMQKEVGENDSILPLHLDEQDYQVIRDIVSKVLQSNKLCINDLMIRDVLMHVNIGIHRMKEEQFLDQQGGTPLNVEKNAIEYVLAQGIAEEIEAQLGVQYSKCELDSLAILLSGKIVFTDSELSYEGVNKYISPEVRRVTNLGLEAVSEQFGFDFKLQDLKVRMMVHIQNLYQRAKYHPISQNPYPNMLKIRYPLVYEIAVTLAMIIQDQLNITVSDDEIAYLALHVGSIVEDSQNTKRLNVIICSPKNYSFTNNLLEKISKKFEDDIIIKDIVHTANDAISYCHQYDLLITTVLEIKKIPPRKVVEITPFFTDNDLAKVNAKIKQKKKEINNKSLQSYMKQFLKKELFYVTPHAKNEIETISFLCNQLEEYGYADATFENLVLEREKLSSTVLRDFLAMPHIFTQESEYTTISVLVNDQGIQWNGKIVKVVILLNVKAEDNKIFNQLLTTLIEYLSDEVFFNALMLCDSSEKLYQLFEKVVEG